MLTIGSDSTPTVGWSCVLRLSPNLLYSFLEINGDIIYIVVCTSQRIPRHFRISAFYLVK